MCVWVCVGACVCTVCEIPEEGSNLPKETNKKLVKMLKSCLVFCLDIDPEVPETVSLYGLILIGAKLTTGNCWSTILELKKNKQKKLFLPHHLWRLSSMLRRNLSWVITSVTVLSSITPPRSLLWFKYSKSISHTQIASRHIFHTMSDFSLPLSTGWGGVRVKSSAPRGHRSANYPWSMIDHDYISPTMSPSVDPPHCSLLLLTHTYTHTHRCSSQLLFMKNKPSTLGGVILA